MLTFASSTDPRSTFLRLAAGSRFSSPFCAPFDPLAAPDAAAAAAAAWAMGEWWTRTTSVYDLVWWPSERLKDSDGMESAGALLGGCSSEGLTGTSLVPSAVLSTAPVDSFRRLWACFTRRSSTPTRSEGRSPAGNKTNFRSRSQYIDCFIQRTFLVVESKECERHESCERLRVQRLLPLS